MKVYCVIDELVMMVCVVFVGGVVKSTSTSRAGRAAPRQIHVV